jgi:site-specific DNA recombinase
LATVVPGIPALYRRLRLRGINLVGIADGVDTSRRGASVHIALKGVMNALYLEDLAEKTHRGLAGQITRGKSAGGRTFGYRTVNGNIELEPTEADIVRRIFRKYAEGRSMKAVVNELKRDAVPFPSKETKRGPARRGWAISSVHTILHNVRYIGNWTWNKTRFLKDPDTGKRKPVARARDEWMQVERPELRIIDAELWQAVQARLADMVDETGPTRARRPPGGAHAAYSSYLLSGFLRCGLCGARMQGMRFTRKKGSGASYTYSWYVCGFAKDKGPDVCQHRVWYRRDWLEGSIVDRFRYAMTPPVIEAILQAVRVNVNAWAERRDQRANELKAELVGLEREAANLVQYLRHGGTSATVRDELEATEAAIRGLKFELANAERTEIPAPKVEPAWIKARIERLCELLRKDPARAKREMAKHFDGDPTIIPLPGDPGQQRAEKSPVV